MKKDMVKAVKWFRKAAEQGNAVAQCNLGWSCEDGDGIEKNLKKAVEWYRKAAQQGSKEAAKLLRKLEVR